MTEPSMRLSRSLYLVLFFHACLVSPPLAIGGTTHELSQIETHLDEILGRELSPRKARGYTYQILARIQGWLTQDENLYGSRGQWTRTAVQSLNPFQPSHEQMPILIRILSKTQSLAKEKLSPWDESFSGLISRVVLQSSKADSSRNTAVIFDASFLKEEIRQLLSQIKAEELFQIKERLEKSPKESAESATQTLVQVATWLSTLEAGRDLTPTEQQLLAKIVSDCRSRTKNIDPSLKRAFKDLDSEANPSLSLRLRLKSGHFRKPVSSDIIETHVHRVLGTGSKLTNTLNSIEDLNVRKTIFGFLPEDEARSKAQISRAWRSMLHDYQKRQGYPSGQLPKDKASYENKLNEESRLSEEERALALQASDQNGYGEYRDFLYSIFRVCLNETLFRRLNKNPNKTFNPIKRWTNELELLAPRFSSHSQLSRLTRAIIDLQHFDTINTILQEYKELAESGNVYAQQTIKWIQELDSLGTRGQRIFQTETPPLSVSEGSTKAKMKLPEAFPDYERYLKWKEAVKITFRAPVRGNYSQEAALSRLYRNDYLRFADPVLFSYLQQAYDRASTEVDVETDRPLPSSTASRDRLPTPSDRTRYFQAMRRNTGQWNFPDGPVGSLVPFRSEESRSIHDVWLLADHLSLQEAANESGSGNTQRAASVLQHRLEELEAAKTESSLYGLGPAMPECRIPHATQKVSARSQKAAQERINEFKKKTIFYDLLLASDPANELLAGKDETTQKRILEHLGMSLKNMDLDSLLKQKPQLDAANLLNKLKSEENEVSLDSWSQDSQLDDGKVSLLIDEIRSLYWIGAGKEEDAAMKDERVEEEDQDLSLLSSISRANPFQKPHEASETIQARRLLKDLLKNRQEVFPYGRKLLQMLTETGRLTDATDWVASHILEAISNRRLSILYSQLKDYKSALIFFERYEQEMPPRFKAHPYDSDLWLTRFAQAYSKTGNYPGVLWVLAYKKEDLNFVDHALRTQALTQLKEEDQLHEALLAKEKYERLVLLPDLKQAARIYEEDGDLEKANQLLLKASKISDRE